MGARFISNTISDSKGVQKIKIKDDTEFSFEYQTSNLGFKIYKAYVPTRDDYQISLEVIDRALSKGCNLVVYDHWIFSTHSGIEYAGVKRMPVYSVPAFIRVIKNMQKIENV